MSPKLSALVLVMAVQVLSTRAWSLELQWSNGSHDITVANSQECVLLIRSTSATDPLPSSWHLSWTAYADSAEAIRPLGDALEAGLATVCDIRPAISEASVVARTDTAYLCAGEDRATLARHVLWIAAGTTGRIRLILDGQDATAGQMEVTINGGSASPLPPTLQAVATVYSGTKPSFIVFGDNLANTEGASLVQDNCIPIPLAVLERGENRLVVRSDREPVSAAGYLEAHDDQGQVGAAPLSTAALGVDRPEDTSHLLIRFRPGAVNPPAGLIGGLTATFQMRTPALAESLVAAGVISLIRVLPSFRHEDVNAFNELGEAVVLEDLADVYAAELSAGSDLTAAQARLERLSDICYAGRNMATGPYETLANDTYFTHPTSPQWGLKSIAQTLCGGTATTFQYDDIGASFAWDRNRGSSDVKIAILDSGIDNGHTDLQHAVLDVSYVPNQSPYDFSVSRHGTAVAGIAAALGNNAYGISGVGWNVTPVAVKIFDSNIEPVGGTIQWMVSGLNHVRDMGYPIVNISGGFPRGPGDPEPSASDQKLLNDACYNAYISGAFIAAAMGNTLALGDDDYTDPSFNGYPARFKQRVFAVGAKDPVNHWRDKHYWLSWCMSNPESCGASNWGEWIDALAPGGRFIVTDRASATYPAFYDLNACSAARPAGSGFSGTSAATPFVAGAAGLLKSYGLTLIPPVTLTNDDIEAILKKTARYSWGISPPWDRWHGYGLIKVGTSSGGGALGFIAPPNVVVQGRLLKDLPGASLDVQIDSVQITSRTFNDVPGLPSNSYTTSCWQVHLKGTARHGNFVSNPNVWIRPSGTQGWRDTMVFNYGYEVPWAKIVSIGTNASTFETYVYRIPIGGGVEKYFPVAPPQAQIAFTAVGPMSTTGVGLPSPVSVLEVRTSPNPSPQGVWVDFALPRRALVNVSVLDVGGRTVAVLKHDYQEGRTRLRWNARDQRGSPCAAGLYWCVVESEGKRASSRFVLLGR